MAMTMCKRYKPFVYLVFLILFGTFGVDSAQAMPLSGHTAVANQYLWGLTTADSKALHSETIDKVPWRNNTGGWEHRDLWGHSDEWFYEGRLPRDAVLKDIRRSNPALGESEVRKIYKEATSMTGQERIAAKLRQTYPNLSQKEAMAAAEQTHAAHILGDSTTAEGVKLTNVERARAVVQTPSLEAVAAENKMAMAKALKEGASPAAFVGQAANFERLKVEEIMKKSKIPMYNPQGRYAGIVKDGQPYIYRKDVAAAKRLLTDESIVTQEKIILPDDEYQKFIRNRNNAALTNKVVPESQITGKANTLEGSQAELQKTIEAEAQKLETANRSMVTSVRKKMTQAVPYMVGGALMAAMDNWELLDAAYRNDESWEKALTHTGIDFAGYTVTPMLIDGVLCKAGEKVAVLMPLKNAGLGFTIGYFCWGAGKEFYAYQTGDIAYDEMLVKIGQRAKVAASGTLMIPVNMLVLKIVAGAGASTAFVPILIIGGGVAIQRAYAWYQEKIWENTIYVEDVVAMLGPDLVKEFTLLNPEKKDSLIDPQKRDNLLDPQKKPSLLEPEQKPNMINPEKHSQTSLSKKVC